MVSRLAPTPSGYLHWGNLYNFAQTWTRVRQAQGVLWLRIDDVDASRYRKEYVMDLFETLRWLGLDWDRGPQNGEEFERVYSQSLRTAEYRSLLDRVPTYVCACSRREIALRGQPLGQTGYDGHCRQLRLDWVEGETCLRAVCNDLVVWTRENRPAYHWASVCDDVRMQTTHLIRGEDLRESSEFQLELARVAGWKDYLAIQHEFHPLLLDSRGVKYSKSADSESLKVWRDLGKTAEEVWIELSKKTKRPELVKSLRAWANLD
jgi:glutamyl/glutaminyl-tRNA synthetase